MINISRIAILTALTFIGLSIAPLSYAQTPTLRPVTQLKCDIATTRIDALVIKAEARSKHISFVDTSINNWWSNIGKNKFISTYGQSAYDQLNTYFSTLHTSYGQPLIDKSQSYATDLQKLQSMSQEGDCGTSSGNFVSQLQTVKGDRDTLNTDIKNWRDYFNNTIRAYVKSLTPSITPTPSPSPSDATSNNSGSITTTPAVCSDIKPASAPTLISVETIGPNSVRLYWSKALDPVSYYLIAYGTTSGTPIYGNPNVGDANTTSYTVTNLSGGVKYYFTVRAGNGCTPGDFSNEVASTPTGAVKSNPADGFSTGVLGSTTQQGGSDITTTTPVGIGLESNPTVPQRVGINKVLGVVTDFFNSIYNFFAHLF